MTKLSVNQMIFKELWVVDYMKAYEWAKENGLTDEEMQVVLHELNKEEAKMRNFINVYAVTREFAGHEEGGWWYNDFECIKTVQCEEHQVTETIETLTDEFQEYAYGDIYSSRGGMEIRIYAEASIAESETTEVPSYE